MSKEDFSQRWEAFSWPQRLKLKQEETERMLQEDRQLFQKEMSAQQQQFEKQLEELAYRVANFHQYTDATRITKVVSIIQDIQQAFGNPSRRPACGSEAVNAAQVFVAMIERAACSQALKDFDAKAQLFNKREALFDVPRTEYDQLQKIVKDFEPYASLWLTAFDWQKWQREWLDGPLNALVRRMRRLPCSFDLLTCVVCRRRCPKKSRRTSSPQPAPWPSW